MNNKLTQFAALTIYLSLLNIVFFLIGIVFIPDYMHWSSSKLNLGNFILIAVYSFIQTVVFPLTKKSITLVSLLSLFCGLIFTFCETSGFGNEIWCDVVLSTSKCNHFLGLLFLKCHPILLKVNFPFFYATYIYSVGYSFKFLYERLFTPFVYKRSSSNESADNDKEK